MEILKFFDLAILDKISTINKNKKYSQDSSWRDEVDFISKQWVTEVLDKLDRQKLLSANLQGYNVPFFNSWNKYILGQEKLEDLQIIIEAWSKNVIHVSYIKAIFDIKWQDKDLIGLLNAGFQLDNKTCTITGTHFLISIDENWDFKFSKILSKRKKLTDGSYGYVSEIVPLDKMNFENKVYEEIIELKTGNLIINDWFRTESNHFSKSIRDPDSASINTISGVVKSIIYFASKNFISVNISDLYCGIYQIGNKIIVGNGPKNSSNTFKGSVSLDLWAVSMIEEEHFVYLLVSNGMDFNDALEELKNKRKIQFL